MAERRRPIELQALAAGLAVLLTTWPRDASWHAIRGECGRLARKVPRKTVEARALADAALELADADDAGGQVLARTRVEIALGAYFRTRFAAALGALEQEVSP